MRLDRPFLMVFFRIAAVVFMLNSTVAYGACCVESDAEQPQTGALPCHTPDSEIDVEISTDCCESCVPVVLLEVQAQPVDAMQPGGFLALSDSAVSLSIEPPIPPPD